MQVYDGGALSRTNGLPDSHVVVNQQKMTLEQEGSKAVDDNIQKMKNWYVQTVA